MKPLLPAFFAFLALAGCKTGVSSSDLAGNTFTATISMGKQLEKPENGQFADFLASAKTRYTFDSDGTGLYRMSIGSLSSEYPFKWHLCVAQGVE